MQLDHTQQGPDADPYDPLNPDTREEQEQSEHAVISGGDYITPNGIGEGQHSQQHRQDDYIVVLPYEIDDGQQLQDDDYIVVLPYEIGERQQRQQDAVSQYQKDVDAAYITLIE